MDSYYKGLDSQLAADGMTSVSRQTYPSGTTDFSTFLTSIKQANPDVIMSAAFQADAGRIAAQARKLGMTQPIVDFLGEGWGNTFTEAAGSALDSGDYYVIDSSDAYPVAGTLGGEIDQLWRDKYGDAMPAAAKATFDTVLTINAAIDAGMTTKQELLSVVSNVKGEGVLGPIGFGADLRPNDRITSISKVGPKGVHTEAGLYLIKNNGDVERVER